MIEEVFPLSPMQQGMLFHSVAAGPEVYAVQVCCTLEREPDMAALAAAWQGAIGLHPALRSDFDWEELDEPVQVVHRVLEVPIDEAVGPLAGFLEADRRRPFDLAAAPLLRLTLVRDGEARHLVWTYHHILLDGWSALLVLGQVLALYAAARQGRTLRLEAPRRFSEYVAWLRRLDPGAAEQAWRRELRGFHEPTPLPVRPGGETGGAGVVELALGPEIMGDLRAFARRRRLTLNTLVQGAWALVLARVAGEEEVLFGAAVSGRPPELPGSESMVGLFLNTLPVRVPVPPAAPLADWLGRLQARQLELRQAQYAPLAAIQGWSELPRDRPLFESLLVFENHPVSAALVAGAGGIGLQRLRFHGRTHYPLALTALPGESLELEIAFDPGRVEAATARALLAQTAGLLTAMAAGGEVALAALPALSRAESHQVLREPNDTSAELPSDTALHRWFEKTAARWPEAVAVTVGDRSLTYRELAAAADRLARRLLRLGVGRGEPVAVSLGRSERVPVALLAVLKAGGAYVPLDPTHPQERRDLMLVASGARIVLTEEDVEAAGEEGGDPDVPVARDDLAYLLFTSGSTGRPKGVAVPHGAVINLLADFARRLAFGPGQSLLALTTFSFDIAGLELFLPLVTGGRVVIAPPEAAGDGRLLAELLAGGADAVQATPSTWRLLLAAGWDGEPALTLLCGGEALPRPLAGELRRRGAALWNLYGPTETTIWSLAARVEEGSGEVPIGRPLANTQAHVLDAHLQPLPAGLPGELYLGGAGLARGYFGLPAETAERFVPDPWGSEPGGRLYRTGDRVLRRPDGDLEFLGRADQQVKVRGFRVEPGEIEAALVRHPDVCEAAVVARSEDDGGRRLVAYLVPRGEAPAASVLGRYLRGRLPEPLVPSAFVFLPDLPRTANGKLDRRALPDPGRERPAVETAFQAPRNGVEETLARIWRAVLKLDRVGVFDNFFELGGDSIRSVQVVARAAQEGLRLTPDQIFSRKTIAALAEGAGQGRQRQQGQQGLQGRSDVPVVPGVPLVPDPGGEIEALHPVSSVQQGMLFHSQLAPGSAVYFEQVACTLRGPLRERLFQRAWELAAERHPVLRSAFLWNEGEPRQAVFRRAELPWRSEDLRDLPTGERAACLAALLEEDRQAGFDPERPPLARHALIRLRADEWRWIWSFHHALLDGWSVALLLREVFALYAALIRGETPALPAPPSHGYFAWLEGRDREAEEAWWRAELRGLTGPTGLDLGAPAGGEMGYGRHELRLPAAETQALLAAARRAGLTLHTVLQGAWALLLARYSGEEEVVFGTTSSGRPAEVPAAESLLGSFVSTLPARVRVPPAASPLAWLRELQERQAAMRRFERTPLTEIQGWSEVPAGVPLFECVEVLENYPAGLVPETDLGGLAVSDPSLFERTNYPLSFMALPGERLALVLLYDRPRFAPPAMARMASHLARLASGLLEDHHQLADLPMLATGERQQLLAEWNDAGALREAGTVLDLFRRQAERAPGAPAVVEEGREIRYGELDRRSDRLAASLIQKGVRSGDVVALTLPRGIDLVVSALAAMKAGAAYLPLDPETPAERLRWILDDAGARVTISGDCEENVGPLPQPPDSLQTAYVIYTSGSTGWPKGVAVGHAALRNLVDWHVEAYGLGPDDCMTLLANPAFDASVWEMWPPLTRGASLHVVPREVAVDPERLVPWLAERRITVSFLPTPLAELALDRPWPAESTLRLLLTGGDRLRRVPGGPTPFRLINHYGPTEAAVVTTAGAVEGGPGLPPIGRPIANLAVHLLGPDLDLMPPGAPGELCIAGAGLAQGYPGRPDLTAAAFVPHPFAAAPGERLYRTGDRARWLPDGRLEFLGRIDRQVKVRGLRIEPGEIEAVLARLAGVRQAVVRPGEGRLVAYVTAGELAEEEREGLRRELVGGWRELYDSTYGGEPAADPDFDVTGWRSSFDGAPIPPAQMREWVDGTVERVRALAPRRVLEIGCGTGLLLLRLAPHCERYCGTDFSRRALDGLAGRLPPGASLLQRAADDFSGWEEGEFDLVILNSIVQYFPDATYLRRVLAGALRLVGPGGAVFVGDVRSLPLLPDLHAAIELHRTPGLTPEELRRRVERRVAQEEELVIDPRFFTSLAGRVEVLPKQGRSDNELVRYRYDVVLRPGSPAAPTAGERLTNDPLAVRAGQRLAGRLREALRRELPGYMVPADMVLLPALPLTSQGKIDFAALPPPDPPAAAGEAAFDPLEEGLATVWAEVLGVERIGRDDSFFELGGHSLLAVQLMARVREAFAAGLPLATLFAAPTIAGMAAELRPRLGRPEDPTPAPEAGTAGDRHLPFPLTPIQRGFLARRRAGEGANACFELEAADEDGTLVPRLEAAMDRLIARHDMLRAVVLPGGPGGGQQAILPEVPPCRVEIVDLDRLAALREELRNRAADPGRWPLFALAACRLESGALRLLSWFDALILDGPSREILCRELEQLVAEPAAELVPLAASYRDYAMAVAAAEPRLPIETAAGAPLVDRYARLLGPGEWSALRARAARAAATPSTLALAALVEVLARESPGFSLGIVSSYRHAGVERVIGNFSRLMELAVDGRPEPFDAGLRSLQEQLSRLLDGGGPAWDGGRWPQVIFNSLLEAGRGAAAPAPGSRFHTVEVGAWWPGSALIATVAEDAAGGLECKWQSRDASLPAGASERWLAGYRQTWERLAALDWTAFSPLEGTRNSSSRGIFRHAKTRRTL